MVRRAGFRAVPLFVLPSPECSVRNDPFLLRASRTVHPVHLDQEALIARLMPGTGMFFASDHSRLFLPSRFVRSPLSGIGSFRDDRRRRTVRRFPRGIRFLLERIILCRLDTSGADRFRSAPRGDRPIRRKTDRNPADFLIGAVRNRRHRLFFRRRSVVRQPSRLRSPRERFVSSLWGDRKKWGEIWRFSSTAPIS